MNTTYYITIKDFCESHEIEESFIFSLREHELVTLEVKEEEYFIRQEELPKLEKMIRLSQELGINLEGLEAVHHLLELVEQMQDEVNQLKNKLRKWED
ncbi:chaperone modulator CbpM [Sediminicola arcticus]|jgi:chaperone modulatory protein CbpM|uniref:Chaperone modulator CbpM n=1 Tax=Sediminicola arcticus TaxID=1574308 RepID=A0ABV2SUQ8_9FLAO